MKNIIKKSEVMEDEVERTHGRIANIVGSKVVPHVGHMHQVHGKMNVSTKGVLIQGKKLRL